MQIKEVALTLRAAYNAASFQSCRTAATAGFAADKQRI